MGVDISAVIVTYNSASVISALLDSIPAAMGRLTFEVIVVDNDSSDDTRDVVSRRPDARLIPSTNGGFAAGVNLGIANGSSRYVLVLNPDVTVSPFAVTRMVDRMEAASAGVVAPKVFDQDGALHHSLRREPSILRAMGLNRTGLPLLSEYVLGADEYREPRQVDWALGAALLISRKCLQTVGPWDESFFLYSEETDFCLRAGELGMATWYEPSAEVVHIGGASGRSAKTHVMQIVNRVRLYRRRHGLPAGSVYYALTILSELSWALRGAAHSRAALVALVLPSRRPAELASSGSLIPR